MDSRTALSPSLVVSLIRAVGRSVLAVLVALRGSRRVAGLDLRPAVPFARRGRAAGASRLGRRLWVYPLTLFLVPVVSVAAAPQSALAADRFSGSTTVTDVRVYDTWMSGDHLDCNFNQQYRVADASAGTFIQFVNIKIGCTPGSMIDGPASDIEMGLTYNGNVSAGGACSASTSSNLGGSNGDIVINSFVAVVANAPQNQLCEVDEVCWTLTGELEIRNLPNRQDVSESGCFDADMGVPRVPGAASACPYGTPGRMSFVGGRNRALWYDKAITARIPWTPKSAAPYQVTVWYLAADNAVASDADTMPDIVSSAAFTLQAGTTLLDYELRWSDTSTQDPPAAPKPPIVGWQMFINSTAVSTGFNTHTPNSDPTQTRLGMSRQSDCEFYVGPRIQTRADTIEDDPYADMETDPTAGDSEAPAPGGPGGGEDTGCTFSLSDPGTWASAGMCAAVGLLGELINLVKSMIGVLGSILGALADLASAIFGPIVSAIEWLLDGIADLLASIWDGFTGLMSSLFVPADGYMDNKVGNLRSDFDSTSPAKWSDAVAELEPGSVSGCAGLPMQFDLAGIAVDERIGAACSGTMATVASLVRLAITAVLYVGGAFACLRALGSGFGWAPTVGRVGDA